MGRTKGKRFADKKTVKEIKRMAKEQNYHASQNKSSILNNSYSNSRNVSSSPYDEKNTKVRSKKTSKKRMFIFNVIIVICLVAIIISSYNIAIWFIDNRNSKALLEDIYNTVTVSEEQVTVDDKSITKKHFDIHELLSKNRDTVGWVDVENTNINYPIVQYSDNDYYLTHSFDKSQNSAGWVFADYRCNCSKLGYNTVIYGHNRKDQSMFGSLQTVLSEEWYSNEDNLYIYLSTLNEDHVYRVFSTFICNDQDVLGYTQTDFSNKEEFASYVQNLRSHSSRDYETDLTNTKQILTLYTCYGLNNQRLLVCAALVD